MEITTAINMQLNLVFGAIEYWVGFVGEFIIILCIYVPNLVE